MHFSASTRPPQASSLLRLVFCLPWFRRNRYSFEMVLLTLADGEGEPLNVRNLLSRAVVILSYHVDEATLHMGGGVFVGEDGLILTTNNFLESWGHQNLYGGMVDGVRFEVVVVYRAVKLGLAVLWPKTVKSSYDFVLGAKQRVIGNCFHHIGHHFNTRFSYSAVVINCADRQLKEITFCYEQNPNQFVFGFPGDWSKWNEALIVIQCTGIWGCSRSGSPIFDASGNVVGLYIFHLGGFDYAVSLPEMEKFDELLETARRQTAKKGSDVRGKGPDPKYGKRHPGECTGSKKSAKRLRF